MTPTITFVLTLLLGPARAVPSPAPAAQASRPNIVFIMADDFGYGDLGVYGQTKIHTPRLDRMAKEGTRFTQFYAGSPVCAPSRSALMTGQHTGHTYIRGNKEHPAGQEPLPDSVTTVADLLKQAGYTTGLFGKWGLGGPDTEGTPMRHSFDEFFGYYDQRRAHFYYPEYLHRNAEKVPLPNQVREEPRSPGAGPAVVKGRYSQDAIAEEALAFLERHQREPFFLYLPFTIPHAELQAPDDAYALYVENGRSIFPETPFAEAHYGAQAMPHATYAVERGKDREFAARLVNYADDFVILSRGRAKEALEWARRVMAAIGLSLNETKTCLRNGRREPFDFLGYTFGPDRYRKDGHWYVSAKPSKKAVRRLKEKVRAQLRPSNLDPLPDVVRALDRLLRGWANYFSHGSTFVAYRSVDSHVYERMRNFLRRRHKVSTRGTRVFGWDRVFGPLGVISLGARRRGRIAVSLA